MFRLQICFSGLQLVINIQIWLNFKLLSAEATHGPEPIRVVNCVTTRRDGRCKVSDGVPTRAYINRIFLTELATCDESHIINIINI